jgi:integrase
MQAVIGSMLLSSKAAQPTKKPFEIYDSRLSGFILRVQPTGVRSYYARFGRNRRVALGQAGSIEPDEARERCQIVLGNVAWYPEPLTAITVERVEAWKARRLNEGRNPVTVVRDLYTLSSVLRRAVKAGELTENPVRRVDKPRVDRRGKVRFLDQAEETRLRQALKARDEEMRNRRTVAHNRRQTQHERTLPPLTHFGDHLTAAVLLSMNTGLRRGEALKLRWGSVDFNRRLLTVEGRNAKNRQTRHVPLNEEAVNVLRNWREQAGTGARVFDVVGFQTAWETVLKRARISKFRWHDLRHHFASRLVQQGVPLNTVRDLLGHGSVGMSLRYAHFASNQRREAVAKLNQRPLLTLTMRLQWEGLPVPSGYRVDSIVVRDGKELAGQIPLSGESARLGVALISAFKNGWISRLKTKKGRFLRLRRQANPATVGIALI